MVERERDEGEAMALCGPRHQGGEEAVEAEAEAVAAAGEKEDGERDDGEGDAEEERKEKDEGDVEKEKEELEKWSEIRLAIAELSPISHGKLSSSPPTLPFLSIALLILQVLGEWQSSARRSAVRSSHLFILLACCSFRTRFIILLCCASIDFLMTGLRATLLFFASFRSSMWMWRCGPLLFFALSLIHRPPTGLQIRLVRQWQCCGSTSNGTSR
jgi:hypothetical protein